MGKPQKWTNHAIPIRVLRDDSDIAECRHQHVPLEELSFFLTVYGPEIGLSRDRAVRQAEQLTL
jgi:hypothetical protein